MAEEDARLRARFDALSESCARQGVSPERFGLAWLRLLREESLDLQCRSATVTHFLAHALDVHNAGAAPSPPAQEEP
jgi:hypothetical protein